MAPLESLLTDKAWDVIRRAPPFLWDDPDARAVAYCIAQEADRADGKLADLLVNLFPQLSDGLGLSFWEALLRITIAPAGKTDADRRAIVMSYFLALGSSGSGLDWETAITNLIGPGWTYEEHRPGDPLGPPPYTVRVYLPFAAGASAFAEAQALIEAVTPANLALTVSYAGGFVLDQDALDQQLLG